MPDPTEPVSAVLDQDYKKPFMLIVAIVATLAVVLFGLTAAEKFVDGRIELKLAGQKQQQEDQAKRIEKMEQQFGLMRDTLAEIRADVRVLRSRIESESGTSHAK